MFPNEFLRKVHGATSICLCGEGQNVFFSEVGPAFHGMILEHLKRFSVNLTGGLILTNDLVYYQQTIGPPQFILNERFEMLYEIGTLFVVKPENLRNCSIMVHRTTPRERQTQVQRLQKGQSVGRIAT
ncbi:exocyst complex component Sec10-domain-containing protein [Cladochytrium replicatum]|nr:exocyst complex component Sec10-domain-containing protein [Cladochytrium replicatum]